MKRFRTLPDELKTAGASADEGRHLVSIATLIHELETPRTNLSWKQKLAVRPSLSLAMLKRLALPALAVLVFVLMLASQNSLPGSWQYPAKRASEQLIEVVNPGYKETIMMRRSQEVQQLVAQHASDQQVLEALSQYEAAASSYGMVSKAHYPAFAFCRTSLMQAEPDSSPKVRPSIARIVASLPYDED